MAGTTPVLDPSWSGTQPPACLRNPRAWGDDLFGAVSDDPSPLITPRKRIQGKPCCDWVNLCALRQGKPRRSGAQEEYAHLPC